MNPPRFQLTPLSSFLKIHFNIILPTMPRLPIKILYAPYLSFMRIKCSTHLILHYLIFWIILGEKLHISTDILKII